MAGAPLQIQEQSKTQEVEITPEMIDAGCDVLMESGAIEHPSRPAERALVAEILRTALSFAHSARGV